jgi:hypothetical protein
MEKITNMSGRKSKTLRKQGNVSTSNGYDRAIIGVIIFFIIFVGLIACSVSDRCDSEVKEKYGVCVYNPEIITGEFVDVRCVYDHGKWDSPTKVYVELIGLNGQKTILPISGSECPSISIGGEGVLTTIIYARNDRSITKSFFE